MSALTPGEHITHCEKCVVTADLAGLLDGLAELHGMWDALPEAVRSQVLKLDAILLTLLNARVRRSRA